MSNLALPVRAILTLTICASLLTTGCVRRRLTVRTEPAGARGYIDDREMGITPFDTSVTYYGTRKIHLEKDGMKSVTVERKFRAPWYQWPVIDFFSENLWPWELRDEREVIVKMQPQQGVQPAALIQRAETLRNNSLRGIATPLNPTAPVPRTLPLPENLPPPAPNTAPSQPLPGVRPLLDGLRPTPYLGPQTPSYRPDAGLLPPTAP